MLNDDPRHPKAPSLIADAWAALRAIGLHEAEAERLALISGVTGPMVRRTARTWAGRCGPSTLARMIERDADGIEAAGPTRTWLDRARASGYDHPLDVAAVQAYQRDRFLQIATRRGAGVATGAWKPKVLEAIEELGLPDEEAERFGRAVMGWEQSHEEMRPAGAARGEVSDVADPRSGRAMAGLAETPRRRAGRPETRTHRRSP